MLSFVTFTEEKLRQVPGNFSSSAFVEKTVGVDNVCERSAMAASPQGILLAKVCKRWSNSSYCNAYIFFRYFKDIPSKIFYNAFADDNKITKGRLLV